MGVLAHPPPQNCGGCVGFGCGAGFVGGMTFGSAGGAGLRVGALSGFGLGFGFGLGVLGVGMRASSFDASTPSPPRPGSA
jgi:hypothetical protein